MLAVPLLATGAGTPSPVPTGNPDGQRGAVITAWVQRLLNTPIRGSLAGDRAFATALTAGLDPADLGFSPELNRRSVLFAGDAGAYRVVLVVFHSTDRAMGVWLVGAAGSTPDHLVEAVRAQAAQQPVSQPASQPSPGEIPVDVLADEVRPFAGALVADQSAHRYLAVGLAPAGCQVETRAIGEPGWSPSGTGDYLVRTDPAAAAPTTVARVTCAGVVRHQAPMPIGVGALRFSANTATEAQIDAALAGVRGGVPDRAQVGTALASAAGIGGTVDGCAVLYSGLVPGTTVTHATPMLVIGCPVTATTTTLYQEVPNGAGSAWLADVRLTDPHAVIAVRELATAQQDQSASVADGDRVLVLAPRTATVVQVLTGGTVSQSAPLVDGVGAVTVPTGTTGQLRVLDAAGTVVGTGTAPTPGDGPGSGPPDPAIDNWS